MLCRFLLLLFHCQHVFWRSAKGRLLKAALLVDLYHNCGTVLLPFCYAESIIILEAELPAHVRENKCCRVDNCAHGLALWRLHVVSQQQAEQQCFVGC